MPPLHLTALHVYPIKSAGGISPAEWEVDDFGLRYDRRWMVIDDAGELVTQRDRPRLALVRTRLTGDGLEVTAPGHPALELPLHPSGGATTTAIVWDDSCRALLAGEAAARWFSELLQCSCRLVYMPDETVRPADPTFAPPGIRVSFADAFPFLLISEESLADLGSRLAVPLPMNRFRPNLVIAGGAPYVEDTLTGFELAGILFRVVKPCDRCVITTTDQETAQRGREPLQTLATYRRQGGKVLFGQNVVHLGRGRLRVGEALRV